MIAFFRASLAIQMAFATVLGSLLGLFLGNMCSVLAPWGDAYIMILKITTIPYLISAIIHGIGRLGEGIGKQILKKGIFFICLAWFINIAMIYFNVSIIPRSQGTPYSSYSPQAICPINFAELIIPDNIFKALSTNIIPAVVVFSILIGISLMYIREKQPFMSAVGTLVEALTQITHWISRITPIGTFLIIANQVGTVQLNTVKQVSTYLITYIISVCFIIFWIFPIIVKSLTLISFSRWIKNLFPILLLAYTTNVVIVTLPFIIEMISREIENFYHKDGRIKDQIQGIVSVTFNLPLGSLFITYYVLFVAIFYHIPLTDNNQVQLFVTTFLTSLGSSGLGSWINSLKFLLDSLGLPLEAIDLYLTTLPFTAGFQSMLSVMEISCISLFITLSCHNLIRFKWQKMLKGAFFALFPIGLIYAGLDYSNPLPEVSKNSKTIFEIDVKAPLNCRIYSPDEPRPSARSGNVLDRILSSKVLRVGYNADTTPFCFKNDFNQLSGYDMAFAYLLAEDLGCKIEFVPLKYASLQDDLDKGVYDIGMAAISVTEDRLPYMSFSTPYLESQIAFIVHKKFSQKYNSLQALEEYSHVKVVALKNSSYEDLVRRLFPSERIITISSYDEFLKYENRPVVLVRGKGQSIAWTLKNRDFSCIIPPDLNYKENFAYISKASDERFIVFLNQWLKLKKNNKFTKAQNDLWILGKTETTSSIEPRWSIIRDVLHWID